MRRSVTMRIFASLIAVWFGFITIQPLYGDPCPHHQLALAALLRGLGPSASGSQLMAAPATASGDMANAMTTDDSHKMHGMPNHGDSDSDHSCRCIGVCCGAPPVAIAQASTEWLPATIAERISLVATAPILRAPQTVAPHTLPFSTAPPQTLPLA